MTCRHLLPLLMLVFIATACTPAEPIAVNNAWLRPPAPGLSVAAGYFDIVNHGGAPIDLIGARSDATTSIEIHAHTHDGDMMQMRRLDSVTLASGQTVSFAPGGHHLMLFGFAGVTSNPIPITLLFSDTSQQTVAFAVRDLSGATLE